MKRNTRSLLHVAFLWAPLLCAPAAWLGCADEDNSASSGNETTSSQAGPTDGANTTGAGTAAQVCTPGDIETCECPGGGQGTQACANDGTEFFPCFCGATSGDSGDATSSATATGPGPGSSGTDSGGVTGSSPVAGIQHPGSGDERVVNTNIPFDGTGLDEDDGILMGEALVWSTDLEGEIGTGTNIQVPLTMLGLHEVTLTVTDSDGNVGSATIFVNIVP